MNPTSATGASSRVGWDAPHSRVMLTFENRKEIEIEQQTGGGKAIASLVLGIVGMIAWFIPLFGIPITVVGLVLGIKGLKSENKGMAVAGVTLSIIGLVFSIINMSIGAYQGATGQHPLFQ